MFILDVVFVSEVELCVVMSLIERGMDVGSGLVNRYSRLRKKINQDRCLCYYDEKTQSIIVGVFDGHGVNGHVISEV